MKKGTKIILIALVTAIGMGSFPARIISGSYTYREPRAIVDETVRKTGQQGLKQKLTHLEEALESEIQRQIAFRTGIPEGRIAVLEGLIIRGSAPTGSLARVDSLSTVPTDG